MTAPRDYSRAALTERLGADVMAHIDALAAASPEPHPDEYAMLRRIFQGEAECRARTAAARTAVRTDAA